ncbi:MAG: hypothetical protein GDA43_05205 [Hormoscilla sp. SP5CHS1]|nr:hypothetical protein [Hormoscilla sp. SP12CHS1]MBC6452663.1 hypothetical protein [Hormoscilla sp. SP5CHS1]
MLLLAPEKDRRSCHLPHYQLFRPFPGNGRRRHQGAIATSISGRDRTCSSVNCLKSFVILTHGTA